MAGRPRGHVNLSTDAVIANLEIHDLRAITRHLVAISPANAEAFAAATRTRLLRTFSKLQPLTETDGFLFIPSPNDPNSSNVEPTQALHRLLARARTFLGCGLGLESLRMLEGVVREVEPPTIRWSSSQADVKGSTMIHTLALIDADISQAVQSATDQISSESHNKPSREHEDAKATLQSFYDALQRCRINVEEWGGEFPFEKGLLSIESLHQSLS